LLISFIATAVVAVLIQFFLLTLLEQNQGLLAGAALVGGWWGNLATAGTVAIFAARRAATGFTDPRVGRLLGLSISIWVGIGAIAGLIVSALILGNQVPNASIRPGLIAVFGLVSMLVCLVAGTIAGREAAQPPEAEEEA
jgi:MFS family permease